jgi:hypothetical protein
MAGSRKTHGLTPLKQAVSARGIDALDARTTAVRAVNEWRTALVDDLGGTVSTQKAALIDSAARTLLFLNHIDCYLLELESLVNKRKRSLWPIVRERQALADSLARLLGHLGLERQQRPIKSLREYIEEREQEGRTE